MKKYLGSKTTAYAAVMVPIFICFPVVFAIMALMSAINGATAVICALCTLCSTVLVIYAKQFMQILYSWGLFDENGVSITTAFSRSYSIEYSKCKSCGIGYYVHGILNSGVGTKQYFIYLSYDKFDESFRTKMNFWKPTSSQLKVGFDPELFSFLIEVLPYKLANCLLEDYRKYILNATNN